VLEHKNSQPTKPDRVVIVGAGGFVGGTIAKALGAAGIPVLPLTRKQVDLLAPGADAALKAQLKPTDSIVFVSAIAPAKEQRPADAEPQYGARGVHGVRRGAAGASALHQLGCDLRPTTPTR